MQLEEEKVLIVGEGWMVTAEEVVIVCNTVELLVSLALIHIRL
jgi:hypothetical protein